MTTEWGYNPTADMVYHLSVMLQNARWDFYANLRLWVEVNGLKELRAKVRMTENNFLLRMKNETFTPIQIKQLMNNFVPVYPPNMYGHDISKEEERELGKIND